MSPKVSIIILNWNGLKDTLECLESLMKIDYENYEVIVVDNNSTGEDVKVINEKYGHYVKRIIINEKNLGFSGGNNRGIKFALESNTNYILLLNNDTIVENDFLTKMMEKSLTGVDTGILTPMIKYFNDPDIIWSAGGQISKLRASGFSFGFNKPAYSMKDDRYCTFATGCCMLIRRDVLETIGLLDENYFLYIEDTDLCQRTISAGYKILYVGSSIIYHKVFSTTEKADKMLPVYFSTRNRLYFARKNLGLFYYEVIVYLLFVFLLKIILTGKNKKSFARTVYYSFRDFFRGNMGTGNIFKIIE